jgi:hypothetical protein
MSDHDQQHNAVTPPIASEPKDGQVAPSSIPQEPEPDTNVRAPKFQYLTEGFDPNRIKKR